MRRIGKLAALICSCLLLTACTQSGGSAAVFDASLTLQDRLFGQDGFAFETSQSWGGTVQDLKKELGLTAQDVTETDGPPQKRMEYREPIYIEELEAYAQVRFTFSEPEGWFYRGSYTIEVQPDDLKAFVDRLKAAVDSWPLYSYGTGRYPYNGGDDDSAFDSFFGSYLYGSGTLYRHHKDGSLLTITKEFSGGIHVFLIQVRGI